MKLTINPFVQLLEKGKKLPDGTRRQYGKFWFKKQGDKWVYDGMATGGSTAAPATPTQTTPAAAATQPSISDLEDAARKRGEEAFKAGLTATPAKDPELSKLLHGIKDPKDAIKIIDAWGTGWATANVAAPVGPQQPPATQTPAQQPQTPPQPAQTQAGGGFSDLNQMTQADFDGLKAHHTKRNRMSEGQAVEYVGTYWKGRTGQKGTLVAIGTKGFALVRFADGKTETAAWRDIKAVGQIAPYSLYDKVDSRNVYRISGDLQSKLREVVTQKIGRSNMTYLDLCREVQKRGFNLQIVGGTVRDILAKKKEIKDVDFIFSGSDGELFNTIKQINPSWLNNATTNGHLGLCSFNDGGDVVDITPVHKFSHELNDMAKGWNLFDDASARDLAMNTLQVDPLNGVLTDATGKGIKDVLDNTLHFADVRALKVAPVYTLRVFKFMARGYQVPPETEKAIQANLRHTANLSPHRKERFMRRQIGEKDGANGLKGFKEAFKKYDAALWDRSFEGIWQGVYRSFGGR